MGVNFPPFRDLRLGFQYLRSRSVAFLTGHFMWHTQIHSAGEWRCRSDLGGVRGDKTSGRTSKARNEAVAIAG